MKQGNFRVYKLTKADDTTTVYFPDVDTVAKRVKVARRIAEYNKEGYKVLCVLYVDKETFLNLRIDETVHSIVQADRDEQEIRRRFAEREMSKSVYAESMSANAEWRNTCMKKLEKQMKRLMFYEDMECHNEIAVELFNTMVSKKPLWLN